MRTSPLADDITTAPHDILRMSIGINVSKIVYEPTFNPIVFLTFKEDIVFIKTHSTYFIYSYMMSDIY